MKVIEHAPRCECDYCKDPVSAAQSEKEAMKKVGWITHSVRDACGCPFHANDHTHGLPENFNHLDLQMCTPASPKAAHGFFIQVIGQIKEGKVFEHGKQYFDIMSDYKGKKMPVLFLEATECNRTVLRMIMPDKDGTFDGELSTLQMEGCR